MHLLNAFVAAYYLLQIIRAANYQASNCFAMLSFRKLSLLIIIRAANYKASDALITKCMLAGCLQPKLASSIRLLQLVCEAY